MIKSLIKILLLVFISGAAGAETLSLPMASNPVELSGRQGVVQQMNVLSQTADLEKFRFQVGSAVHAILASAVQNLRNQGHHEYARQIESEWTQSYSLYFFSNLVLFDLGDHDPLIPWLANVMNNVEKKVGRGVMERTRIYDLKVVNYALPVAFSPTGNRRTGQEWGQLEYGKHFIPLAGVVTYWTARVACKQLAQNQPVISGFCKKIAGVAEKIMVKGVAPKISNSIYTKANRARK